MQIAQEAAAGSVATVVLRSSTEQLLDDLERAVDDGVNTYKARRSSTVSKIWVLFQRRVT